MDKLRINPLRVSYGQKLEIICTVTSARLIFREDCSCIDMPVIIRKATEFDAAAVSRICLLTGDAGQSAESHHDFGELPGLVYAVPYVKLPTTWGFVMVDLEKAGTDGVTSSGNAVVGYVLGSRDTRAYEQYSAEHWWPAQAETYPLSMGGKPADQRYMKLLRSMPTAPEANIRFAAAHLHIDILPEYQRQGWGRKLISVAVEHLKGETVEGNGVWLGLDPRNDGARKFYERLGFSPIEGSPEGNMGLAFDSWNGVVVSEYTPSL